MAEEKELKHADDSGSESMFDFYCELCKEDGKMLEAEGYCVNCKEYLCDTCYTHHRRSRPTRHHVLMDKDKMPKASPLSYDRVSKDISKICEHHTGKSVKYYCKSHDVLGCSICFVKGHRNCSNVESIPDMAETIMESQEYKKFIEMLNQWDKRTRDNIKLVQDNLNKSKNWCLEVAKSLTKFRKEINSILDELEKSIVKQAENLQKEEEEKLMNVSENFTRYLESVEKITGELDQLQKSRKVCDMFIELKESKKETTKLQAKLDEAESENVVSEFVFYPNMKLMEFLKSQNELGKLTAKVEVTAVAMGPPLCNPVNTKATHLTDIEVNFSGHKKTCIITGSAVVSNNRLIILDNRNNKVKLIDTQSNEVLSTLILSSKPWDITIISRNQAAVTLPDSKIILLLSVSDELTQDREITVDGQCSGVAYSKNRLVITYTFPKKLEIMDLSGKVVKRIENGDKLFSSLQYVCVSNDGETMYVSDYSQQKVTSLNFDGEVKSAYSDSEFKWPQKVCVDKADNVFVCCRQSRYVHMLTANLNKIQVILTQADGLDREVFSISHCQETNRMYVGMRNNNKVKVYQLSQ